MKHDSESITRVEHTITVTEADILKWLAQTESINKHANITIEVPRGGDYSGTTLGLDECGGMKISWIEEIKND